MKFENARTENWQGAFRGLRFPMESNARSDSYFGYENTDVEQASIMAKKWTDFEISQHLDTTYTEDQYDKMFEAYFDWLIKQGMVHWDDDYEISEVAYLGPNDLSLAQRMIAAGSPNDKFLRQILVSVDITAPLFYFKEFDTYKIATVTNSTSTMHKLASTLITMDCFEMDDYDESAGAEKYWEFIINGCESLRQKYNATKDKKYWKELIRLLPESWLQKRHWTANYSTLRNIIRWRSNHRLTEWHQFVEWCKTLPWSYELLFYCNEPGKNG